MVTLILAECGMQDQMYTHPGCTRDLPSDQLPDTSFHVIQQIVVNHQVCKPGGSKNR